MGSARLLHLLPNVPLADPPDAGTQISATGTPTHGVWTTLLLDPALPPTGSTQQLHTVAISAPGTGGTTYDFVFGRWLTRPLVAQTIGAGNWSLYAAMRVADAPESWTITTWGFCVAQWRPGTGVIARAVDAPTGGSSLGLTVNNDRAAVTTQAGLSLTVLSGDCLIVEVWSRSAYSAGTSNPLSHSFLFGGIGQYATAWYTNGTLTDTDATLLAPSAVAFS
jgi:hypothetical protein